MALDMELQIRKGSLADLPRLMEIFAYARAFMARSGNPNQWINGYPSEEQIEREIRQGHCFVMVDPEEGGVHATFCFMPGPDPFYGVIEGGAWLDDEPYWVIHRLASDGTRSHIWDQCFRWCHAQQPHLRVDTHPDNRILQHVAEKSGFVRCGIVYVHNGTARIAYQLPSAAQ